MIVQSNWPPEGYEIVPGKCPNEGHACNCIGKCQPTMVRTCPCGTKGCRENDHLFWPRDDG